MDNKSAAKSIDNGIGQFGAEASIVVDDDTPLFDLSAYPKEMHEILTECNTLIEI